MIHLQSGRASLGSDLVETVGFDRLANANAYGAVSGMLLSGCLAPMLSGVPTHAQMASVVL